MIDRALSLIAGAIGANDDRGIAEIAFDVVGQLADEEIDNLIDDLWTDPAPIASDQRRAIAVEIVAQAGVQMLATWVESPQQRAARMR